MNKAKFVIGQVILFFVWPFGSFIASLATLNAKISRIIFVLFAILYGYTFVFSADIYGADNGRIVDEFLMISELNVTESINYFIEDKSTDVFMGLSFFFVSRFSNNPNVLYAFYAAIYSLFFILMISKLFNEHQNKNLASLIVLALFVLYIRFSAINGVRFWIACFIYIYSVFNIVVEQKFRYLILLLFTPLIHFSYVFGVLAMAIYFVIGQNRLFCYTLLAVSILTPEVLLRQIIQKLSVFTDKVSDYTYEGNVKNALERRKDSLLIMQWGAKIAQKFMSFAIFYPALLLGKNEFVEKEGRFFNFLIIFLSLLCFSSISFEIHRRFFEIFIMFGLIFFFLLLNNQDFYFIKPTQINMLIYCTGIALSSQIILGLRAGIETLNVDLLYKSLFQIYSYDNMSVLEFIDTYIR